MAKQTVNTGTSANDRTGDSLRTAFTKINANFTELYTALGLNSDGTLNLGAFEFTGSVMTTTDSSAVTIDQATNITSDLTVSGDVLPSMAQGGDLGSAAKPWRSLHVSANTVFLGGVPLGLEAGTNELTINNVPISQTIIYTDIPNAPTIPADISDLTDTGNLLGSGSAFSGSYNDLTDTPTIPTDITDLTDLTNFLPTDITDLTDLTDQIPTDISDLTDVGSLLNSITHNDDINITINNDDSSSYVWNFGQTGDLTLPSSGLLGQVWGDGIDTELTLKSPPGVGDSGYVALSSANERNYVEVSNIGVVLGVEFGQAAFKKLTFGTDGNLKSADGEPLQILSTGASGAVSLAWSSSLDSPENIALVIANSPGAQTSGAVDIVVGAIAGPNIWTFDPNGDMTIPGDIQSEEDISIRINLSDSTQRVWRFGEDGNFEAPGTVSAPNINATNHFMLPVYATDAARDSAIPSPQPGMMVYVSSGEGAGLQVRGATQWNPVGGLTGV